jgi:hypothetical protein
MTNAEVPVTMWCWPGPRAAAGVQEAPGGDPVLAVFIDPVSLVLVIPPFPDGRLVMARFLRELARSASQMAAELDLPADRRPGGSHRATESGSGIG